ncbi:MAG: oligosaccharide flippase family protein, partial [Nitrospinota bacterium]
MNALETLSRGVFLKTLSNLVVMGFGLAMPVLLNRHFGKEAYGLLVLTYSVTSFLIVLADLGGKPSISRFVPRALAAGDSRRAAEIALTGSFFQVAGMAIFAL